MIALDVTKMLTIATPWAVAPVYGSRPGQNLESLCILALQNHQQKPHVYTRRVKEERPQVRVLVVSAGDCWAAPCFTPFCTDFVSRSLMAIEERLQEFSTSSTAFSVDHFPSYSNGGTFAPRTFSQVRSVTSLQGAYSNTELSYAR